MNTEKGLPFVAVFKETVSKVAVTRACRLFCKKRGGAVSKAVKPCVFGIVLVGQDSALADGSRKRCPPNGKGKALAQQERRIGLSGTVPFRQNRKAACSAGGFRRGALQSARSGAAEKATAGRVLALRERAGQAPLRRAFFDGFRRTPCNAAAAVRTATPASLRAYARPAACTSARRSFVCCTASRVRASYSEAPKARASSRAGLPAMSPVRYTPPTSTRPASRQPMRSHSVS